jgi:hypothetical protein
MAREILGKALAARQVGGPVQLNPTIIKTAKPSATQKIIPNTRLECFAKAGWIRAMGIGSPADDSGDDLAAGEKSCQSGEST